jgi:hypothetical protein
MTIPWSDASIDCSARQRYGTEVDMPFAHREASVGWNTISNANFTSKAARCRSYSSHSSKGAGILAATTWIRPACIWRNRIILRPSVLFRLMQASKSSSWWCYESQSTLANCADNRHAQRQTELNRNPATDHRVDGEPHECKQSQEPLNFQDECSHMSMHDCKFMRIQTSPTATIFC